MMKKIMFVMVFFMSCLTILRAQEGHQLTVEISGLKSDEGMVFVGLYNHEGTWLSDPFMGNKSPIKDGKLTVTFNGVPTGNYSISCFHDENNNGKLDTGWFGIPKEPYACSRGATGNFGPPTWEDAVFEIEDELTTTIKF